MKRIAGAVLAVASVSVLVSCSDDPSGRSASSDDASSTVERAPAATAQSSTVPMSNMPLPTPQTPGPDSPPSTPDDNATIDGTAIWSLEPSTELTAESRRLTVLVMRLGCHGGKSAPVEGPEIESGEAEVVVTFTADPPPGMQTCPGNDLVPVMVDLGKPIGDRRLLDGACRPGSPALETAYCSADGDRRTATAFDWLENSPVSSVPAADLLLAYCEGATALAGERPEAYVGSQQHRADVYKLLAVAPPELTDALSSFATFLLSGAITPADPDSSLTENWPDEVQTGIRAITAFNAANC